MDDVAVVQSSAIAANFMYTVMLAPLSFPEGEISESDEELMGEILEFEGRTRSRPNRRKPLRNEGYVDIILSTLYPHAQFKAHFRMPVETFYELENRIGALIMRQSESGKGRPTISVRTQILASLWLLGTPDSYRSVGEHFDLAKSSLHQSVRRVVKALNFIANEVIMWPREHHVQRTKEVFLRRYKIPDVIGAIDGTYISLTAPKVHTLAYRTRKMNYAMVLQAVCDADLHFIDAFTGYPGSVGDARIFRNCDLYNDARDNLRNVFPGDEFIIGDKAYPCLSWCIPPYKNDRRVQLNHTHLAFNKIVSGARQVIERAFALFKGRFRRMKHLEMTREDQVPSTILASCVLHNLCLRGFREDVADIDMYIHEGRQDHPDNVVAAGIDLDDGGVDGQVDFLREWQDAGEAKRNHLRLRLTAVEGQV